LMWPLASRVSALDRTSVVVVDEAVVEEDTTVVVTVVDAGAEVVVVCRDVLVTGFTVVEVAGSSEPQAVASQNSPSIRAAAPSRPCVRLRLSLISALLRPPPGVRHVRNDRIGYTVATD
jgi:hypothetical protein